MCFFIDMYRIAQHIRKADLARWSQMENFSICQYMNALTDDIYSINILSLVIILPDIYQFPRQFLETFGARRIRK